MAEWGSSDTVALVAVLVTGAVSVAGIITNHLREAALHRRTLEAERARGYREESLDIAAWARQTSQGVRNLAGLPRPTTSEAVRDYLQRISPVFGLSVRAQQAAQRIGTLGWSEKVRSSAKDLSDALLKLGVGLYMPQMIIQAGLPEASAISGGDPGFWERHQAGLLSDSDRIEECVRGFLLAIEG